MSGRLICDAVRFKLREQIERAVHLINILPKDCISWGPQLPSGSTDFGHLLGHILDCLAGVCAVLHAAFPEKLEHLAGLRSLRVNHFCKQDEALIRIAAYRMEIEHGLDLCDDADLTRTVPTLFMPEGERIITLLLGNIEHLINHKYQLFFYLKLLGVAVTSQDIYQYRGLGHGHVEGTQ